MAETFGIYLLDAFMQCGVCRRDGGRNSGYRTRIFAAGAGRGGSAGAKDATAVPQTVQNLVFSGISVPQVGHFIGGTPFSQAKI